MEHLESFIRGLADDVAAICRQTIEHFGHQEAEQFLLSAADGLDIKFALNAAYSPAELSNLITLQAWGLLKEFKWLQFLFLAGNYPLVMSRLRYVWEAVYRACYVEAHADPAVRSLDSDGKLSWIETHRLTWGNCILPTLTRLFPMAGREPEVRDYYKAVWEELNQYVHPTAHLQNRMVDESALLLKDGFDADWAADTLRAAKVVADLVWFAVLSHHEKAIPAVPEDDLIVDWPLTTMLLRQGRPFA